MANGMWTCVPLDTKGKPNINICCRWTVKCQNALDHYPNLTLMRHKKDNVAPGFHPGEGGVNPTVALQK